MSLLKGIDRMRDMLLEKRNVLRAGFRPTTRCCGGAAWANRRWSGLACDSECNACAVQGSRRATQADRDSPPGYRKPARPDGANARRALPLYRAFGHSPRWTAHGLCDMQSTQRQSLVLESTVAVAARHAG